MILQEGGPENFDAVIVQWANYFFKNINTFNTFWTYTNYKSVYLVTFIVMSGILVGFWKNRFFERVTPFLLSTMLVFFAMPFFGATMMNSQIMLTIYFAMVLGCVASLIVTNKNEGAPAAADTLDPEKDSEEKEDASDDASIAEVVKPEKTSENEEETEPAVSENEVIKKAEEFKEAKKEVEKEAEKETEKAGKTEDLSGNQEKRYVPEGMVLPKGAEDEMDVSASKMKMPKFDGTIALSRKEKMLDKPKKKNAQVSTKKDDFDIAFTPGDDFDI